MRRRRTSVATRAAEAPSGGAERARRDELSVGGAARRGPGGLALELVQVVDEQGRTGIRRRTPRHVRRSDVRHPGSAGDRAPGRVDHRTTRTPARTSVQPDDAERGAATRARRSRDQQPAGHVHPHDAASSPPSPSGTSATGPARVPAAGPRGRQGARAPSSRRRRRPARAPVGHLGDRPRRRRRRGDSPRPHATGSGTRRRPGQDHLAQPRAGRGRWTARPGVVRATGEGGGHPGERVEQRRRRAGSTRRCGTHPRAASRRHRRPRPRRPPCRLPCDRPPEGGQPVGARSAREPPEGVEQQVEPVDEEQHRPAAASASSSSRRAPSRRRRRPPASVPSVPCRSPARSRAAASSGRPTACTAQPCASAPRPTVTSVVDRPEPRTAQDEQVPVRRDPTGPAPRRCSSGQVRDGEREPGPAGDLVGADDRGQCRQPRAAAAAGPERSLPATAARTHAGAASTCDRSAGARGSSGAAAAHGAASRAAGTGGARRRPRHLDRLDRRASPRRTSARPGRRRVDRRAASGASRTSVESAASATRSAIRRLTFARRSAPTAPAGRCVASTRCTPSARPCAASRASAADASGTSSVSARSSSTTTSRRAAVSRGPRVELGQVAGARRRRARARAGAARRAAPLSTRCACAASRSVTCSRTCGSPATAPSPVPPLKSTSRIDRRSGGWVSASASTTVVSSSDLPGTGGAGDERVRSVGDEVDGRPAGRRHRRRARRRARCAAGPTPPRPPPCSVPGCRVERRRATPGRARRASSTASGSPAARGATWSSARRAPTACRGTVVHPARRRRAARTDRGTTSIRARHHAGTSAALAARSTHAAAAGRRGPPPGERRRVGRVVDDDERRLVVGPGQRCVGGRRPDAPRPVAAVGCCAPTSAPRRCVPSAASTTARATGSARDARTDDRERAAVVPGLVAHDRVVVRPGAHGRRDQGGGVAHGRVARRAGGASRRRRQPCRGATSGTDEPDEGEHGLAQRDGERDRTDERGQPRRDRGRARASGSRGAPPAGHPRPQGVAWWRRGAERAVRSPAARAEAGPRARDAVAAAPDGTRQAGARTRRAHAGRRSGPRGPDEHRRSPARRRPRRASRRGRRVLGGRARHRPEAAARTRATRGG